MHSALARPAQAAGRLVAANGGEQHQLRHAIERGKYGLDLIALAVPRRFKIVEHQQAWCLAEPCQRRIEARHCRIEAERDDDRLFERFSIGRRLQLDEPATQSELSLHRRIDSGLAGERGLSHAGAAKDQDSGILFVGGQSFDDCLQIVVTAEAAQRFGRERGGGWKSRALRLIASATPRAVILVGQLGLPFGVLRAAIETPAGSQ